MIQTGRYFSLLVLVLSLAAHAATFLPFVPITAAVIFFLQPAVLIAFYAALMKSRADKKAAAIAPLRYNHPTFWYNQVYADYVRRWHTIARVPVVLRVVFLVTAAYAGINFSWFMQRSTNGLPEKLGGTYVVKNKGHIVRPSNEAEYLQGQRWLVRGFSGHWILFSLVPVLFFTYIAPQGERTPS